MTTVRELIADLRLCDPNAPIKVWNAGHEPVAYSNVEVVVDEGTVNIQEKEEQTCTSPTKA